MANSLLLSAGRHNINECIDLAQMHNLGIEIMIFAYPEILDHHALATLADYKHLLADLNSKVTVHGPFMDMVSGSPDPRINAVCVARYSHAIRLAAAIGSKRIIFHANFIGSLHNAFYRDGWHNRNVEFWKPLADYADEHDVTVLLENMWEFDPTIITDVLEDVNHPRLRACLDVGHAHVFSDNDFDFNTWLNKLQPWVDEFHMNNNNGILDEHHGFDFEDGVLDYHDLLPRIRSMYPDADIVLEMDEVADMRQSLAYFGIDATETSPQVRENSA